MISALDRQLLLALVVAARRASLALQSDSETFQSSSQGQLERALLNFELKSKLLLEEAAA